MSRIKIILNGEEKILPHEMTIEKLIEFYELDKAKIAVEKDLEIVDCGLFSEIILKDGDKIEIVHFIGGG